MKNNEQKRPIDSSTKRLIWILCILVILIICLVVFNIFFLNKNTEVKEKYDGDLSHKTTIVEEGNQEKPEETKKEDDVKISLVNQTVYDFDDISFRFVIAKLHVEASKPTNISLEHFQTDEGIVLSRVQDFVKELEDHQYFLGRQDVWFSLVSNDTSYDANIFIPIKNKNSEEITLRCDLDGVDSMVIPLTNVQGTKEMLTYEAEDVITDGKSYEMMVSRAFDITGEALYTNVNGEDEPYYLPSTTKVYEFQIQAVSLFGDEIEIETAEYVPNGVNEVFTALGKEIHSMKDDNIIGVKIKEKDVGYLFFYAYNPDESPITYDGVLKLKLKDSDQWITVNVNLN